MKRRIRVRELRRREGLRGEIVQLFHSRRTGVIHGDDGYDVTFNEESLVVGLSYGELSLGLKVCYGIFFAAGAKLPTGINVQPAVGGSSRNDRGWGKRSFGQSRWDWGHVTLQVVAGGGEAACSLSAPGRLREGRGGIFRTCEGEWRLRIS
jgi:hypothetical protein